MFNIINHSGGAIGSDMIWSELSKKYGIKTNAYSYKTNYHKSEDKVEISDDDYKEGLEKIKIANKKLKRKGISKYLNLLARNWIQVKYSKQIIAIGEVVKPNSIDNKGYTNISKFDIVSGGTGYAVQMG